jgi:4-diphosphocytidyl-2-C-methyl-D-erythritol kinase
LRKVIPTAAGLGGASSDAAAALIGAASLWSIPRDDPVLAELALVLGSDVPFFLRGGTALAEGRGERLNTLRPLRLTWFVVVTPILTAPIPRKTATLYAALAETDRSSGDRVRALAASIEAGAALDPARLGNAFCRPLYALRPDLREIPAAMIAAGAPFAVLTGAGPSHYCAFDAAQAARELARRLGASLSGRARIFICRPAPGPAVVESC